ncbi:F-box/LRR-repeat protein At3g59190-like isoform X1 [Silene latifolia]|uniref:F-box/LRR-repeat protein At3g59190-like isoform X1 n=1 Tax=Silene latifolia TaxID=37657 RepID=UPI003D782C0F
MDFSLKKKKCHTDRLSNLPDELICQILSSLPTKDAAIASLSSKKMRSAFMYLTTLDFDDSPISYCARKNPQRFQIFKTFVNNVLQKSQSPHLSKFRLGFGGNSEIWAFHFYRRSKDCGEHCFPYLRAIELNSWIGFPLSRGGVREIDLRIHVRKPGKMSSAAFTCETLEVLKLDTNLNFELVSTMSSFRLPNLKVLQLRSIIIPEDDFVGKLVSNCPSLQELCIDCRWEYGKSVVISSPSLQKLVLLMNKDFKFDYPCELLNIDTPNLQYFEYEDMLALHNSVTSMKAPIQASINIDCDCDWGTSEGCFREMLNLVQAVCNVQHLSLTSSYLEVLDFEDLKNQLPTFHNLKHLKFGTYLRRNWDDTVLFEFLRRSPVLEVLEFPDGIDPFYVINPDREYQKMIVERDHWFFGKNQASPCCFKTCLKRIVIKYYCGTVRELEFLRSLLLTAPALEELLIICEREDDIVDQALAENTLKELRIVSSTCLITVQ